MANRTRSALLRRLDAYWKFEGANAFLVPVLAVWLSKGELSLITLIPLAGSVLLLLIGTLYWRGKARQLRGEQEGFIRLLQALRALRAPALILCLAGAAAAIAGGIMPGWSAGPADRFWAILCAVLAGLEYVNYYHRQLQHFDNMDDLKRLLAGKGFRRSWLARDLELLSVKG